LLDPRTRRDAIRYPAEPALLAYLAVVAASAWIIDPPRASWIVLGHVLAAGFLGLLRLSGPSPSVKYRCARAVYPLALYPVLYRITLYVSASVDPRVFEEPIRRIDAALFGAEPAEFLAKAFASPALSEVLHLCYLTFFPLVGALPLMLALAGTERTLARVVGAFSHCFFICLLLRLWFPVSAPMSLVGADSTPDDIGTIERLAHSVAARGGGMEASFPNTHAALATLTWLLAYRVRRRWFWVSALPTLGIVAATVYGGFHFASGTVVGIALAVLIDRLHRTKLRAAVEADRHPSRLRLFAGAPSVI